MEIASYFATLGFKVTKGEIKKVDDFLGTIEKGLKTAGKEADTTEKATKKVKKSTDEATKAIKQQLTWQEKLNKFKQGELKLTFAIAQNQKQLARNFKQSVDAMVIKPTTTKKLKEQQALYNGLFGAVTPKKMVGATGSNQSAWNRQFNQRIQQLTQQSKTSRSSRQADLEAVFGLPKAQSNPRVAALINERLGYMGGRKNDALADMAAYYRNEEKVAKLKTDAQKKIEESEKRILEARKRDIERRIRNQERLNKLAQKEQEINIFGKRLGSFSAQQSGDGGYRSSASISRANFLHAGGAAGAFARYGLAALPFVGGVYGGMALNRANQEIISAQLTTQAVTEAAGLQNQGPEAFDWLRSQAQRIGFNYMDQTESYNNFLSNSLGAGLSLQGSQDIYLGFAEYARAMGISPARNKLVMNALSQMMGKGTVSMEELKRQMAESMPGTMDVFAQAYAQMTGSGLKGQEALAALYEAVPTGKVKSAELLPIVQEILRQRAAPKLDIAMKTSQAEQGRIGSNLADLTMLASKSGVEAGMTRLFRTINVYLKESTQLVEAFGRGFDSVSKSVTDVMLYIQSINRLLEGRDSLVADWLGAEQTKQLREDWFELKSVITELFNIGDPAWLPSLKSVTEEFAAITRFLANISSKYKTNSARRDSISDQLAYEAEQKYGKGSWFGKLAYWGNDWMQSVAGPSYEEFWMQRERASGINTGLSYGNDPLAWADMSKVRNEQAAMDIFGKQGYGINQPIQRQEQNNTIYMEFKVEANDPAQIEDWFRTSFKKEISTAMPNFNYKE